MKFWDDLNPVVRRSVLIAVILVGVLFVVRQMAATPAGNVTEQRGVSAQP